MDNFIQNTPEIWRDDFPRADQFNHKYDRGHGVFFGGPDMTGAICMSSYAATRIGLGLATIISPESAAQTYRSFKPHIIVRTADSLKDQMDLIEKIKPDVVVMGPGYGQRGCLKSLVLNSLQSDDLKIVLDADALMAFEDSPDELFPHLNENHIMTPHEGEFKRLFKIKGENKLDVSQKAVELAGCVIVHKGQETVITAPDRKGIRYQANCPYLATAGTGDVLTGFIAGLLGLGMPPFKAAAAGVYLHGETGRKLGAGMVASDMPDALVPILKEYF